MKRVLGALPLLLLAACGNDNGDGNDTLWTGVSGLVIAVLVVLVVVYFVRRDR